MSKPRTRRLADFIVGGVLVAGFVTALLLARTMLFQGITPQRILTALYANSILLGVSSLVGFLVLSSVMERLMGRRPFFYIPLDAALWEYVIFGLSVTMVGSLMSLLLVGAFGVLPVVVPIRLLFIYTFGPAATPATVVASFLGIGICYSLLFTLAHLVAVEKNLGSLKTAANADVRGFLGTYYFASSALLGVPPTDISAGGACRWLVLLELLVGKLMEIIVIGAGLSLILRRVR